LEQYILYCQLEMRGLLGHNCFFNSRIEDPYAGFAFWINVAKWQ
jgi:hypothetical protein